MAAQILVVEDDLSIREMLIECLSDEGYAVASAIHGADALHYLRRAPQPRVILLDLTMPVMDGWEFWREHQRDPALRDIPVVVLSADRSVQKPGHALPGTLALAKPINIDTLLNVVAQFLV